MMTGRIVSMSEIAAMSFDDTKRYVESHRSSNFLRMNGLRILNMPATEYQPHPLPPNSAINHATSLPYDPYQYMRYLPGQDERATPREIHSTQHTTTRLERNNEYESLLALDDQNVTRGVSTARKRKFILRQPSHFESRKQCDICRDNFGHTKICELPCKHTYHEQCINTWFEKHRTCPICRHEVEP